MMCKVRLSPVSALYLVCGVALFAVACKELDNVIPRVRSEPITDEWHFQSEKPILGTHATSLGVLIADAGDELLAINGKTGKMAWRFKRSCGVFRPAVECDEGYVLTSNGLGGVVVLRADTGEMHWRAPISLEPKNIVVARGKCIATSNNKAICLDYIGRKIEWERDFESEIRHVTVCKRGKEATIAICLGVDRPECNGIVVLVNVMNGHDLWKLRLTGRSVSEPLQVGEEIVVLSSLETDRLTGVDGYLSHVGEITGFKKFVDERLEEARKTVAAVAGLQAGTRSDYNPSRLIVASVATGEVRFASRPLCASTAPPICYDKWIFVKDIDGNLLILELTDGTTRNIPMSVANALNPSRNFDDFIGLEGEEAVLLRGKRLLALRRLPSSMPVSIVDTKMYLGSPLGQLAAISLDELNVSWNCWFGHAVSTNVAECGTNIVVGCADGCIYWLSKCSGKVVRKHWTGAPVIDGPALVSGMAVYTSTDGRLAAIRVAMDEDQVCGNNH